MPWPGQADGEKFPRRSRLTIGLAQICEEGNIIPINHFGESGPGEEVMKEFGFTMENISQRVKKLLQA